MTDQETSLRRTAETVDEQLRLVHRSLRKFFAEDEAKAGLTAPQTLAMEVLARSLQAGRDGMTIGALRTAMGLSQSTVSGVIARLERKGFVHRDIGATDHRQTVVRLAGSVKSYLESGARSRRLKPLMDALGRATPSERELVVAGIAALHRLLTDAGDRREHGQRPDPRKSG